IDGKAVDRAVATTCTDGFPISWTVLEEIGACSAGLGGVNGLPTLPTASGPSVSETQATVESTTGNFGGGARPIVAAETVIGPVPVGSGENVMVIVLLSIVVDVRRAVVKHPGFIEDTIVTAATGRTCILPHESVDVVCDEAASVIVPGAATNAVPSVHCARGEVGLPGL